LPTTLPAGTVVRPSCRSSNRASPVGARTGSVSNPTAFSSGPDAKYGWIGQWANYPAPLRGYGVPGRADGCPPAPPQTRTSGFPAYGSSGCDVALLFADVPLTWSPITEYRPCFPSTIPQPCVPLPYSPAPGASRSPSFLRYYEPAKTPLRLSGHSVCDVAADTLGWLSSFAPCGGIVRHRKARMLLSRSHPFRRLSPRTLSGLPCSLGTPVCSCRALRPRSDLGAWLFTALRCCPR